MVAESQPQWLIPHRPAKVVWEDTDVLVEVGQRRLSWLGGAVCTHWEQPRAASVWGCHSTWRRTETKSYCCFPPSGCLGLYSSSCQFIFHSFLNYLFCFTIVMDDSTFLLVFLGCVDNHLLCPSFYPSFSLHQFLKASMIILCPPAWLLLHFYSFSFPFCTIFLLKFPTPG